MGIVWLVGRRLIFDSTPVAEAEDYGDCKTHGRSHSDCWTELQKRGTVPRNAEYDQYPRGRVVYNRRTRQFRLMLDGCIIRNTRLVSRIMGKLSLPKNTNVLADSHYRCARCMGKKPTGKEEEEDWDF